MKNLLFVCGHLHAGTDLLIAALNENARINIQSVGLSYDHPTVLDYLFNLGHKINDNSAVYGDEVLHNANFSCKAFYRFAAFAYLIRSPKVPLAMMVESKRFQNFETAGRYYCFRLRRIYEMMRQTKPPVFLTWEDLFDQSAMDRAAGRLRCKLRAQEKPAEVQVDVPLRVLDECEKYYEDYLYRLRLVDQHV